LIYQATYTPGYIFFDSIVAIPSNADVSSTYIFKFYVRQEIPIGGIIDISFPSE